MQQESFQLRAGPQANAGGLGLTKPWRSIRKGFAAVDRTLALWHFRSRSRRELARLESWMLRDAGLDPIEVHKEASKPFWKK